jgi:tRNA dimethylallyltransferase
VSDANPPLLIVGGPTGSGKSQLAIAAAQAFDGEVINADSMQMYRELRILTARPTADEETLVPHRLFGVLPIDDPGSVGTWLALARAAIEGAWAAGRLPIVVGGTGLYLGALTHGIADVPTIPPEIRADAARRYECLGGEAFRTELAAIDPDSAARLPAGDRQRLIRADEVARATGRPLADWQSRSARPPVAARFAMLRLSPPRARLYAAIEDRFDRMLTAGALAEVAAVAAYDPSLPGMKALGVRPLLSHLRGKLDLNEAARLAKRDSRRYAKRQLTWLRHHSCGPEVTCEQFSESSRAQLFAFIRAFLLTGVR